MTETGFPRQRKVDGPCFDNFAVNCKFVLTFLQFSAKLSYGRPDFQIPRIRSDGRPEFEDGLCRRPAAGRKNHTCDAFVTAPFKERLPELGQSNPSERILREEWDPESQILVFDEVHKYDRWKGLIKGIWDTRGNNERIIVTGSSRLDTYRRGGDSLLEDTTCTGSTHSPQPNLRAAGMKTITLNPMN